MAFLFNTKIIIKTKLGLGLSLSAFQFSLDEGNLSAIDPGDVVLTGAVESTFVPDANFGAYLYSDKYEA